MKFMERWPNPGNLFEIPVLRHLPDREELQLLRPTLQLHLLFAGVVVWLGCGPSNMLEITFAQINWTSQTP